MDTLFLLQILLITFGAGLVLIAILAPQSGWKKIYALVCFIALIGVGYAGWVQLLGQPKPIKFADIDAKGDGVSIVATHIIEDVGIYVWTTQEGSNEPVSYALPWRLETARKLQEAQSRSERTGNSVKLQKLASENPNDQGEWVFHVPPPQPLPPKRASR